MADTVGFLSSADLDYTAYRNNLKTFLKAQDRFKDYDFEGSNMAVLLDLLAYNTYQNGFYLNMVGSETFLDTATLRESVVSRAKELNYVPRSRVSSKAVITVQVTTANTNVSTITIPKNYYFSALGDGTTYLFSTNEAKVIRNEGGTFNVTDVDIYEGRIVSEYFVANTTSRYVIASSNVDVSSIEVVVQNSQVDTTQTVFTRAYNLYGVTDTDPVFFLQGYGSDQYEVVFGTGITGKAIQSGNVIKVTYRDCSASDADSITRFTAVSSIIDNDGNVFNTITPTTQIASVGGAERETIDSIKFNAPRHFASQDRAITKDDYTILIRNNFPQIQAIAVFGGEELEEKRYGKVVIATKPYSSEITPTNIKSYIADFLGDRTSVAIDPVFIDPDYFYVEISSDVSFDVTTTNKTTSDIESLVRSAITTYNDTYLYDFNSDFRYSRLVATIDAADASIVSNDTTCRMVKRIFPIVDFDYTTVIKFNNALWHEDTVTTLPLTHNRSIESSFFTYTVEGTDYTARILDDGMGTLIIVSDGGITLNSTLGTVDYTAGKVAINTLNVSDYSGHISIYARLAAKDVIIQQNQIIIIDQNDVTIDVNKALF